MKKIKDLLKRSKIIISIYDYYKFQKHKYLFNKNPKLAAEDDYKNDFKRELNWENPKDIAEKNFWMQFNTDTEIWTRCADKYAVREYVVQLGAEYALNELYGKWDDASDIDFDKLPNKFVLKTNHGCNTVIIVKDKSKLNRKKVVKQLNKWLNYKYGIVAGQLHYLRIKPCIIAEKFLEDGSANNALIDYKIFCFDGRVESICVHSGRNLETHDFNVEVYDKDWKELPVSLRASGNSFSKPESLDTMIQVCEKLGKGIPFVRIDFYEIEGKAIFGEMTFTPGSGFLSFDYYDYLGTLLDINQFKN